MSRNFWNGCALVWVCAIFGALAARAGVPWAMVGMGLGIVAVAVGPLVWFFHMANKADR